MMMMILIALVVLLFVDYFVVLFLQYFFLHLILLERVLLYILFVVYVTLFLVFLVMVYFPMDIHLFFHIMVYQILILSIGKNLSLSASMIRLFLYDNSSLFFLIPIIFG